MAIQLSDVIAGVRGRHPAFSRPLVPDAAIARFLTGYQRELVSKAILKDRTFLAQQMSVAFAVNSANAVGTAGAGTTGGMPVDADVGALSIIQAPMGTASELDVDEDEITLVSAFAVSSATTTTVVKTSAGWTTNAYANKWAKVTTGKGQGQIRQISSNTADTLTVSEAWTTTLDTTSMVEVVTATAEATQTFGVVASEPWSVERKAYLVKLTSAGVPYLELDSALTARYDVGIPLPPMHYLIGGDVRFEDPDDRSELALIGWGERMNARYPYCASVLGQTLYLAGTAVDWSDVVSLDLRYAPIPPALTATTDYFLVPDSAYQAMVDAAAYHAAIRVNGAEGVPMALVSLMGQSKMESERAFLREVAMGRRAGVIRPWSGN